MTIQGLNPNVIAKSGEMLKPAASQEQDGFVQAMSNANKAIESPEAATTKAIRDFAHGVEGELHQTLLTMDKAQISLKFLVSVRNRCLDAYKEIMHMGG